MSQQHRPTPLHPGFGSQPANGFADVLGHFLSFGTDNIVLKFFPGQLVVFMNMIQSRGLFPREGKTNSPGFEGKKKFSDKLEKMGFFLVKKNEKKVDKQCEKKIDRVTQLINRRQILKESFKQKIKTKDRFYFIPCILKTSPRLYRLMVIHIYFRLIPPQ